LKPKPRLRGRGQRIADRRMESALKHGATPVGGDDEARVDRFKGTARIRATNG